MLVSLWRVALTKEEEHMEQVEAQQQEQAHTKKLTFRDYVDIAIIFGCIPALILNIVFWAIAIAFASVGLLSSILALLITLLLSFIALILIVRYVDITVISAREYNASYSTELSLIIVGAGAVCLYLAICIIGSLSTSGVLEGWHYTLMISEVLFVGYQTWRVFLGRQKA
jgi:hypothetical protein